MKSYVSPKVKIVLYLLFFFCIIASLTLMTILYRAEKDNFVPDSKQVFSQLKDSNVINCDLNGDGNNDILTLSVNKNKYVASIQCGHSNYILNPTRPLNSLGNSSKIDPIHLKLIDLNRDNIPEILIQSSEDKACLQHIFSWCTDDFKDVYSSTNNTLGVIDFSNNKTPRFVSFDMYKSIDSIKEYMYIGNSYKDISYEKSTILGLNAIKSIIDIVENPYEPDEIPDIFHNDVDYYSKSILWRLAKNNYSYKFKDSFFTDTKSNSKGIPTEYNWNLRFLKENKNDKNDIKQIEMTVYIRLQDDQYKISGISLE